VVDQVFCADYADSYDILYADKDYVAECDLIERVFQAYGDGPISSVIDLGCGTGNHALRLAARGYAVTGVERSPSMLARARGKAAAGNNRRVQFEQGDIRHLNLRQRFDAALMMFAVLGYQLDNGDVLGALQAARLLLRPGGLFMFDIWYGPAVLHQRPSERVKVMKTPEGEIIRIARSELDVGRHACSVNYHIWRIENHRVVAENEETHRMRYFFPMELQLCLESSGFKLLRLGAFPDFDRDPDETTWNCVAIAQAA